MVLGKEEGGYGKPPYVFLDTPYCVEESPNSA